MIAMVFSQYLPQYWSDFKTFYMVRFSGPSRVEGAQYELSRTEKRIIKIYKRTWTNFGDCDGFLAISPPILVWFQNFLHSWILWSKTRGWCEFHLNRMKKNISFFDHAKRGLTLVIEVVFSRYLPNYWSNPKFYCRIKFCGQNYVYGVNFS